jgi:hypothetical protein
MKAKTVVYCMITSFSYIPCQLRELCGGVESGAGVKSWFGELHVHVELSGVLV